MTGLLGLVGCVVAVKETIRIDEPVARIEVDVSVGDVRVTGASGPVLLVGTFGGAGRGPISHTIVDEVLFVQFHCDLCAGELAIQAPPYTELLLKVTAGDLSIEGMSGRAEAVVEAGQAVVSDHGPGPVVLDIEIGDVDATFANVQPLDEAISLEAIVRTGTMRVEVPGGGYRLDLTAPRGNVRISGPIIDDPMSERMLDVHVGTGSIRLEGR